MCKDPQVPMTLAIADCQKDLHVISFTGLDALNEAYRFDIDLISSSAAFDPSTLPGRDAYLHAGPYTQGIHGQIHEAVQIHAGNCRSLYRVTLMPALQALAQRTRRRFHHDLTAPQLIARLLESHGLGNGYYRFEHMTGIYPCRPLCVQYDESDLHLLQRLCEEEGIHFRFEHAPAGHTLIFSDDPASFPEQRRPAPFHRHEPTPEALPGLTHLAEHRSFLHSRPISIGRVPSAPPAKASPQRKHEAGALNDTFETPLHQGPLDQQTAYRQQRSVRHLERLRCERRELRGSSNLPTPHSGEIMQVLDHPEPLLNDQWLLVEVRHAARQLQVLEGADPDDISAIIAALPRDADNPSSVPNSGYSNRFKVVPWSIPFRPSIRHNKPGVTGLHTATLMPSVMAEATAELPGLRPIRFDWQNTLAPDEVSRRWPLALVCNDACTAARLKAGTRVVVRHLDNDPERPLICGVVQMPDASVVPRVQLDGIAIGSPAFIHLRAGQRLRIQSDTGLGVRGEQTKLQLTPHRISLHGRATLTLIPSGPPDRLNTTLSDLRLTEQPGLRGAPLAGRIWYIVRMPEPGLHHLARLAAEHFLFEGKTDDLGYLGLSETQRQQLAGEYRKTPYGLWLIHPGQCLALHAYFQLNWTQQQRKALGPISNP